jgi:hypothetical protein
LSLPVRKAQLATQSCVRSAVSPTGTSGMRPKKTWSAIRSWPERRVRRI